MKKTLTKREQLKGLKLNEGKVFLFRRRVLLAALLLFWALPFTTLAAEADKVAIQEDQAPSYLYPRPPDIFSPDFKDPYNFASLPYPFEEDYAWGRRVEEIFGTSSHEEKYIRFVREAKKTGNPYVMVFLPRVFAHDTDFWLDWASRMSTEAWTYLRYTEQVSRESYQSYYYYEEGFDQNDPWALYKIGGPENIKKAADAGLPAAMENLAIFYMNGSNGYEMDKVKAFYLAAEAARRCNPDAWDLLAIFYSRGIEGLFPPDINMTWAARITRGYLYLFIGYETEEVMKKGFPTPAWEGEIESCEFGKKWALTTRAMQEERVAQQYKDKFEPLMPQLRSEINDFIRRNIEGFSNLQGLYDEMEAENGVKN